MNVDTFFNVQCLVTDTSTQLREPQQIQIELVKKVFSFTYFKVVYTE